MGKKQLLLRLSALFILVFISAFVSSRGVAAAVGQTQASVRQEATMYGSSLLYPDGLITGFDTKITIDQNGNAVIAEELTVYFPSAKHGIYRFIPNEVILDTGKTLSQPIKVTSVEYRRLPETSIQSAGPLISAYSSSKSSGNYTVLKIGEANTLISGAYEYSIVYTMKPAIRFQEGFQELYLNITGDKWEIPVLKASAEVLNAAGVAETKCFTGSSGSKETNCEITQTNSSYNFKTNTPSSQLAEGLTIAIKYADGTFQKPPPPSLLSKIIVILFILSPLLLPILAFLYGYNTWSKYGKDLKVFAIPPIFIPTKEMETENISIQHSLLGMKAKPVSTLAELIRLAERGLLSISYEKGKVSLQLTPEQQISLPKFLESQPQSLQTIVETLTDDFSPSTSINALKNVYTYIDKANKEAAAEFKETPYITDKSESVQSQFTVLAIVSAVATVGAFYIFAVIALLGLFLLPGALIACTIIFGVFAYGMLKRTQPGEMLYRDLLGLKKYIKAAEVRRLEFFNDPKKMIAHFEQILPYAVILGLDRQWAKEFGPILEQLQYQPTWMTSDIPMYNALPRVYAGMASQMTSSMAKISTPPQSSSSSFGGGGGGGFSGGGSGGGGGGSW